MNSIVKKAYDAETFRKTGHELVDLLAAYLEKNQNGGQEKVMNWKEPAEQLEFWKDYLEKGKSTSAFFSDIIENSIHLHNPKYMGHQVSAPLPITSLAAMASALLNNGMAVYEMGPAASALEKWIAGKFAQLLGYDENADGIITSGGTLATLTAMLAARKMKAGDDIWKNGNSANLAVMVSEQAHYCVDRAARIMGFGEKGVIKIPVDNQYKLRADLLGEYLEKAKTEGLKVIAVIGSACSTSTGTYDDLLEIGNFCEKHNLWFHVDAAHGGGAIVSGKYRPLLKGIEQADSVIIDFHKMLMNPALSTLLMFKNGQVSYLTFNQKANYLWKKNEDEEWYNYAKRTFECTKLMMSLKFYSVVQAYGFEIFDEHVTYLYDLGKQFAELINQRKGFELAVEPMSNIVCFRFVGNFQAKELNELNARIRQEILEKGEFYIVQTELNNQIFLRTTLMNPMTETRHLVELLDEVERLAKKV
ncbi:MAG TPA: aminotransferase class I/II-fold pyridoxal phosphate-dependent enzyme [Bacteroidales bacterium]